MEQEFIQNIASQFDDIDTQAFNFTTNFKDNEEYSSLTAMSIIAMIDEVYNVKITGDEIRVSETIEDLYNKVNSKK